MNTRNRILLFIGGSLYIIIGGYHIILPYHWNWPAYTSSIPDMIEWALYAVNFLMSSLMVLIGIFTLLVVKRGVSLKGDFILLLGGCFWILNFGYQLVSPTPVPQELSIIKISFLIPLVIGACCYFIPAIQKRN